MRRMRPLCYTISMQKLWAAIVIPLFLLAQEPVDEAVNARIRAEAKDHSQVMHTAHILTDRYGPRLTGSPNFEAAAKWVLAETTSWGLRNAHLEPWNFGHSGWLNQRAYGYLLSPVQDNLTFEVLAWTPSTRGAVRAAAIELAPPASPTKEELAGWLEANKLKVKGKERSSFWAKPPCCRSISILHTSGWTIRMRPNATTRQTPIPGAVSRLDLLPNRAN
jgi:hypothetical protein